jgi:glycosyltransferase involved in cell wall biosynthesis
MHVSIIICTYNRCASLERALESLLQLRVRADLQWEALVVDNNSTDRTKELIQRFAQKDGSPVVYLFEETRGSSEARNAGIRRAKGEIICFLDDDVIVHPDWLTEICNGYSRLDVACLGGRALLPPHFRVPRWWCHEYDGPIGECDLGDEVIRNDNGPLNIIGANISFRRFVFEKYGLLRPELSRRGSNLVMGEETDLVRRLRADGQYAAYYPSAIVCHVPSANRVTLSYLSRWYYRRGEWECYASRDKTLDPGLVVWFGAPRWLYRTTIAVAFRAFLNCLKLQWREAAHCHMQTCFHLGSLISFVKAGWPDVSRRHAGTEAS